MKSALLFCVSTCQGSQISFHFHFYITEQCGVYIAFHDSQLQLSCIFQCKKLYVVVECNCITVPLIRCISQKLVHRSSWTTQTTITDSDIKDSNQFDNWFNSVWSSITSGNWRALKRAQEGQTAEEKELSSCGNMSDEKREWIMEYKIW